jgi:uncharacterized protein involved in type VI secretion and phage assembly
MLDRIADLLSSVDDPSDPRVPGIAIGTVIGNEDTSGTGRVQVRLPWLPGVEPWAHVATMAASSESGTWFIPQVDDTVVLGFAQGDVREAYILGCIWTSADPPPAEPATDAKPKRLIRSPEGHEVEIDDHEHTVVVRVKDGAQVHLGRDEVRLEAPEDGGSITITSSGELTISATSSISLDAPQITLSADGTLELSGDATASLKSNGTCSVQGSTVTLN